MENSIKEALLECIKNSTLSRYELRKLIIKTMIKYIDNHRIKQIIDDILDINSVETLNMLSDKIIENLFDALSPYTSSKKVSEMLKELDYKYKEVIKERDKLKEYFSINNQELITLNDKDLNNLHEKFIKYNVTSYKNCFVVKHKGRFIIPKSYYEITKE